QGAVAHKQRHGDRSVAIRLPDADVRDRVVALIDDIASTGRTLACAAGLLYARGAAAVHALVTHALFDPDAERQLREAGVRSPHSTDSIAHPSNAIALSGLLATGCAEICARPAEEP